MTSGWKQTSSTGTWAQTIESLMTFSDFRRQKRSTRTISISCTLTNRGLSKNVIPFKPNSHETFWRTIFRYCDKRYCDKKTFFSQYFFSCVNWKCLFLCIWIDFEMSRQYFSKKMSFYLFIAISFYLFIAILCAKMSRVNKALTSQRSSSNHIKLLEKFL